MDGPTGGTDDDRDDAPARHRALVALLKERGDIATPRVEEAFRAIPRHLFLPDVPLETVYLDVAIATKMQDGVAVSSSSQPAVMAVMLEQLDLRPGQRVLEIGAGTGYNAALMAHLVGDSGRVTTIDIDDDIVARARMHLAAVGTANVEVIRADGADGYAPAAPYDRIMLTASAWDIAPAWWAAQLRPGGRLLLPLVLQGNIQKLVAFERDGGGEHLVSVSVRDGGFMPLRGAWAGPQTHLPLGPGPGLVLGLGLPRDVDTAAVYALLRGSSRVWPTSMRADARAVGGGISFWLALHAPEMCSLTALGEEPDSALVPDTFAVSPAYRATVGLLDPTGLCVLARPPQHETMADLTEPGESPAVWVRSFGQADALARRLIDHLTAWEEAGRPSNRGLRIRAYLTDAPTTPGTHAGADAITIVKQQTRLVFDWPAQL